MRFTVKLFAHTEIVYYLCKRKERELMDNGANTGGGKPQRPSGHRSSLHIRKKDNNF
ncbi:hypothetical protein SAMN05216383_12425 [Prevotella sp. KH2C16]|nr:hypothetical protein SAMN05216383_12425 [Prevotella sp. KH2C16]